MRAQPRPTLPRSTQLGSIDGGRCADAPVDEVRISRTAGRNERNEPWTLAGTDALRRLEHEAAQAGMDLQLALRLSVETALVTVDLVALEISTTALDRVAAEAAIGAVVDGQHSSYLRRLSMSTPRATQELPALVSAGLPTRLSTRLLATDVSTLVDGTELSRARAWELAAVIDGRTISEWASLTALRLLRA